jgi:UDP-N-acetylmuramoyl-L-alanyl-D-glutamate--2,6-diaminopimelate ligase
VLPGDIYAALSGFTTHGAEFAAAARDAGAAAVLTDPAGLDRALAVGLPVLLADDARAAMGVLAAWAYGDPAASMLVVGVTGTNGKTTTTYLLESALRACGHRTGVIGTVGTRIDDDVVPTVRTTPESTDVHALLAVMRERGVTAVAMEVSSHALVLGRVDGLRFDVAVFTNLSRDHLDFHGDMESYFAAKARCSPGGRVAPSSASTTTAIAGSRRRPASR